MVGDPPGSQGNVVVVVTRPCDALVVLLHLPTRPRQHTEVLQKTLGVHCSASVPRGVLRRQALPQKIPGVFLRERFVPKCERGTLT